MLFQPLRRIGFIAALACISAACSSSSSTTTALPHPTVIEVTPEQFASPPACDAGEGSLQRYVATLIDTSATGESANFRLPSSAFQVEANGAIHYEPIPCRLSVDFGWVVSGHKYRTELLGFDRSDIELLEAGLPVVVDAATRAVVKPRWTALCGGATPVQAEAELTRTVRDCGAWKLATE